MKIEKFIDLFKRKVDELLKLDIIRPLEPFDDEDGLSPEDWSLGNTDWTHLFYFAIYETI